VAIKRKWDISLVDAIISDLINEIPLDNKHKDHPLSGNHLGCQECHIKPDWLLIYQVGKGIIVFERMGSYSDLF
jgi:mRNA interferase YafQ